VLTISACTFDALYLHFAGTWHQQDDIVHPLHDGRCISDSRYAQVETVWTFDLDNDILRFDKEYQHKQISLELARRAFIATSDFKPYSPLEHPKHTSTVVLPQTNWSPRRKELDLALLKRRKALLSRVLDDFAFQWRHVLCGPYNNSTFRRLAYAFIRLLTLDFTVVELVKPRQGTGGALVRLQDLPKWNPWSGDIVRRGGVSIVFSQHTPHAISLIQADLRKWKISSLQHNSSGTSDVARTYLIFTMREMILYQISEALERQSKVQPLFSNAVAFSPEAVDILLEATQSRTPVVYFQNLTIELQDMILDRTAAGPLLHAKLGCNLNIGSAFTWRRDGRDIEREESIRNRSSESPVESQIWFDDHFSGLAYK
jgi:hypothetical protein